ncbi:hypothetical protein QF026_002413 [Streptomyces aurantiacus]|nr:hypothetical protein [Streptomyces aurantiacus]
MATLKSWRLLRKLRCSTTRVTSLVQAILTLTRRRVNVLWAPYATVGPTNSCRPSLPQLDRPH